MKVRKRPIELEAHRFEEGMEDGYMCYEIDGRFIGYWPVRADVFIQTYEIIQPNISTEVLK